MNYKPSAKLIDNARRTIADGYAVTFYREWHPSGHNFMAFYVDERWLQNVENIEVVATIDSVDALNAYKWEGAEL